MAKKATKPSSSVEAKPAKKAAVRAKTKVNSADLIEKACEASLDKLKSLKAEIGLQSEIEWCLGSYRNDKNPAGLYEMASRALTVFKAAAEKNSKAVSKKLITDIEKAISSK